MQSVGPKVALAVLSGAPPRELLAAVAAGDVARLQAAPGSASGRPSGSSSNCVRRSGRRCPHDAISISRADDPVSLAREALIGLGYTPAEVDELLDGAAGDSTEELISHALRSARR